MIQVIVFHSVKSAWKGCQIAIGVAKSMKNDFEDLIDLQVYTNDSPEAKNFEIKSATSVYVNRKLIPLKIALSKNRMKAFLEEMM